MDSDSEDYAPIRGDPGEIDNMMYVSSALDTTS
jgi:hypothetical protein